MALRMNTGATASAARPRIAASAARPGGSLRATRGAVRRATAVAERPATGLPYDRVFNFSAGPACLPLDVLEQAQRELLNWQGSGMSVMEMSHRGKEFTTIIEQAEADLRALLSIPDDYAVLFPQGGASLQFCAIPMNLAAGEGDSADYVVTGSWSKKAFGEAKKYTNANLAAQGDGKSIPDPSTWKLTPGSKYVHFCSNETIGGVEFLSLPNLDIGDRFLVADMSSDFLSRPIDVSKFGLIYAGAQKNVGPAGVTIVIVKKALLEAAAAAGSVSPTLPSTLNYASLAKESSMVNTPPCFSIYMCGLVFSHMLAKGGIEEALRFNEEKAKVLYDAIDASEGFYSSPVDPAARSLMNVPFTIPSDPSLEKRFIAEADALGMGQLKGHRSVGGMRASIYNSMPLEGVKTLAAFMADFAKQHAK